MSKGPESRRFLRAPVPLEVRYRTRGSFLVSYSLNLSKGGLFLESSRLYPVGTRLTVHFDVPGADEPIETEATVMWVRQEPTEDGLPPGVGLRFDRLEERIGVCIDRLVQDFTGVKLLAVAGDPVVAGRLGRLAQNILSCEVDQDVVSHLLEEGITGPVDVMLLDLDSAGVDGLGAIAAARRAAGGPVPVVGITRVDQLKAAAQRAGAASVLDNPPSYEVLRRVTLDVLGKPCTVPEDTTPESQSE